MKRRILALVTAFVMVVTMLPASAFAEGENTGAGEGESGNVITVTPENWINKVETADEGSVIKFTAGEYDITETINIRKKVEIDASGAVFKSTSILKPVFEINTDDNVIIRNFNIGREVNADRFMNLESNSTKVTLFDSVIYVKERGISYVQDGISEGGNLTLDNTKFRCSKIEDDNNYNTETVTDDPHRGISVFDVKNSNVILKNNSEISGFGYAINVAGKDNEDENGIKHCEGLSITVDNSLIRGWTSFNVWGAFSKYHIVNSEILGINNGERWSFSAITFNDDIYHQFDGVHAFSNEIILENSTVKNYQNEGLITDEQLFRIDNTKTSLILKGNVNFIDTTGKLKYALDISEMPDKEKEEFISSIRYENATVNCQSPQNIMKVPELLVQVDDSKYIDIESAINDNIDKNPLNIKLLGNIELDEMLDINRDNVIFDFNNCTISASPAFEKNSDKNKNHLLQVTGDNVTLKNGSIITGDKNKHALNVYAAENCVLENMTLDHTNAETGAPLVINGSDVTVNGRLTTITGVNSWYAVNVDNKGASDNSSELKFNDNATLKLQGVKKDGISVETSVGEGTSSVDFGKDVTIDAADDVNVVFNGETNNGTPVVKNPENAGLVKDENGNFVEEKEEPPVIVYPVISRIAAIADQEYTGSAVTPALTVYDTDGNIISSNNYTATYTNNIEPGTATVTVTGKAGVLGSATATFRIVKTEQPEPPEPQPEKPGKVEITKSSSDFGRIRVYFDKVAAIGDNTIRYQIQSQKVGSDVVKTQYATVGYSYATVRDLAYNAKYNIKIRAYYVDENGERIYGDWSEVKSVYANRLGTANQVMYKAGITKLTAGKTSVAVNLKKVAFTKNPVKITYQIAYKKKGATKFSYAYTTNLKKTVYNLSKNTNYQFKVRYYYKSLVDDKLVFSPYTALKTVKTAR